MQSGFDQVLPKFDRARAHFEEVDRLVRAYIASDPYRVVVEIKDLKPTYTVASIAPMPTEIPLAVGDCVHNLTSALDHLAFQLREDPAQEHLSFPTPKSAEAFEEWRRGRNGWRPDALAALEPVRPYKGGNADLWDLRQLTNFDKHRLLLTVGVSGGIDLGDVARHHFMRELGGKEAELFREASPTRLFASKPLTVGSVLYVGREGDPADPVRCNFQIAIADLEGSPDLGPTLKRLFRAVGTVLDYFKYLFFD